MGEKPEWNGEKGEEDIPASELGIHIINDRGHHL